MRITTAKILSFRNLAETELSFSPQVNLFLGGNGQGKTNLLEALNYVALGRSHRGSPSEDLIRFGSDHLHVSLTVTSDNGEMTRFEYGVQRGGGRRVRIDGRSIMRRAELVGRLTTVFFSPESIALVQGGPEKRRRFADQGVASVDRFYLEQLRSCQRVLRQKARLLQEMKKGRVSAREGRREIEVWNRELAHHTVPVCRGRAAYARRIGPHAARTYAELAGEKVALEFVYKPGLEPAREGEENENLEKDILGIFDYIVEDEIRRGRPISGPQMDDFVVRLAGRELRAFGSQGENRTAAIALILAQSDVVFQMRYIHPVLFFDDIFSELDRSRSRRLQELSIQRHQIFIATARAQDVVGWQPHGMRIWEVKQGRLEAVA